MALLRLLWRCTSNADRSLVLHTSPVEGAQPNGSLAQFLHTRFISPPAVRVRFGVVEGWVGVRIGGDAVCVGGVVVARGRRHHDAGECGTSTTDLGCGRWRWCWRWRIETFASPQVPKFSTQLLPLAARAVVTDGAAVRGAQRR